MHGSRSSSCPWPHHTLSMPAGLWPTFGFDTRLTFIITRPDTLSCCKMISSLPVSTHTSVCTLRRAQERPCSSVTWHVVAPHKLADLLHPLLRGHCARLWPTVGNITTTMLGVSHTHPTCLLCFLVPVVEGTRYPWESFCAILVGGVGVLMLRGMQRHAPALGRAVG